MTSHVQGKRHGEMAKACSSRSVTSFLSSPQTPQNVIEAETLWTTIVTKYNLAFETINHATKLIHRMFPDSAIAKKFASGHSKTAAINKEALAPHHVSKALQDFLSFFHYDGLV